MKTSKRKRKKRKAKKKKKNIEKEKDKKKVLKKNEKIKTIIQISSASRYFSQSPWCPSTMPFCSFYVFTSSKQKIRTTLTTKQQ